jgi:hypothetical protein
MVEVRHDKKRGCGWRKAGGLYLVSDGPMQPCGKLPIPLAVCPTCHGGIKPTRSWTWIDADALLANRACDFKADACLGCGLARSTFGKVGLLWVGGKFYPSPSDWTNEALRQGVSRRIPALPRGFNLGTTWVFIAHREAIATFDGPDRVSTPGVFHTFKPRAVEFVVRGTETAEELEAMRKRGITPIRIERMEEQPTSQQQELAGVAD